jgi:hypothetical protein
MTKHVSEEVRQVLEIAEKSFDAAHEILQIIEVMERQNFDLITSRLSDAGAARAGIVIRNSLITRITLLVAGAYSVTRDEDLHVRKAFELLQNEKTRASIEEMGSKEMLITAEKEWEKCLADPHQTSIKHFRDKSIAHFGKPKEGVQRPSYNDFFKFARRTSAVMEMLAHSVGKTERLDEFADLMAGSAVEFWRPWTQDAIVPCRQKVFHST